NRKFLPVREPAGALQIVNRLLSITRHLNGVRHPRLLHGVLQEEYIVRIVFDLENCFHSFNLSLTESRSGCLYLPPTRSRTAHPCVRSLCARWSGRCRSPRTPWPGGSARTTGKSVRGFRGRCRCHCP